MHRLPGQGQNLHRDPGELLVERMVKPNQRPGRADALAAQLGAGFALTDEVKATIRQHQPVY